MVVLNKISKVRIVSMVCVILIFALCLGVNVSASAKEQAALMATSELAERGDIVSVSVNLKGNPGIWGLKIKVGYDHSVLTLTSVENGKIFGDKDVTLPDSLDKEEFGYLAYLNSLQDNTADGTIVTLKFTVSDSAEFKPYTIKVSVVQAINADGEDVDLKVQEGTVSVVKCIHIMSPNWESDTKFHWHNCLSSDCGKKIENTMEQHQVVEVPAVNATCTNNGLTKGTKCSICGAILEKQTVIPATGHTPVICKAVKATTKRTGLTEGKKCKICGKILVAQKEIPKISNKMNASETNKTAMNKSAKTSGRIKMYQKKKTSSKVIKKFKKGVKITIIDIKGSWYKIKYKGKIGYIKSTSATWKSKIRTKEGNLRLRSGPGKKYEIISSFPDGTAVTVISANANGWYKVRIQKGKKKLVGYLYNKYIIK